MRKFVMLVLLPTITMLGGTGAVTSASAAPSPRLDEGFSLRPNGNANLCLEVADANTGNGALVTLWPCTGNPNQKWVFEQNRLRSALPGNKCLDIRSGNTGDGAAVNTYDCHPGDPQLWRFSGDTLISSLNGKCLSVLANNFAAGAAVVNFGCNGGRGQSWRTTT
ncbi:RICIN domain-containing protein [Actinomadura syzygii]|uniref:Ricin-type beta-trefoil lectin domain protein n=1 Tax=Actinomadura syzygii TaxID=1427538 RepID=A0A5D0UMB1_9ACTN|nr:RICIN domain-containing protein [Actinomadura syzygii]TYC18745.1 ricin-type beta-trefoil lectin domain protein [Actinomadura syzygii]